MDTGVLQIPWYTTNTLRKLAIIALNLRVIERITANENELTNKQFAIIFIS